MNSGTLSPNPWDLTLSGQNICWRCTEGTRTEDKAPQGCDLSADSSAGMARGGFDAEAVPTQIRPAAILAYCGPKMVLTKGSTLEVLILADFFQCEYRFFVSNEKLAAFEQTESLYRRFGTEFSKKDRRSIQEFFLLCECEAFLMAELKRKRGGHMGPASQPVNWVATGVYYSSGSPGEKAAILPRILDGAPG